MNWLNRTFAQYSIVWLFLSAVVGLLAGVVSSWMTYQFKKKEIAETVLAEIEKESQTQEIHQKKEKEDRIREEIAQWANPILGAVNDLERRLNNILNEYGYLALDKNYRDKINPNWSVTYEYFMLSTIYFFAQYFAWIQMLQEKLSFELFQSEQTENEFFIAVNAVSSALGSFPHPALKDCSGGDRQVFRLQQRAIGELLILRDSNPPRCISYPDFQRRLEEEETFKRHLEPLNTLLEKVSPKYDDNCRWGRLVEMRKALIKLNEQCRQVLKLPEKVKQV
jgi:hypothetical protein